MITKKQIENIYTDAVYEDEAPNVFANKIIGLIEHQKIETIKSFVKYITPALDIDIGFDYLGDEEINDYLDSIKK
jgi:hypothetical protein